MEIKILNLIRFKSDSYSTAGVLKYGSKGLCCMLNCVYMFCCVYQVLFPHFSPLITFQKEVFIVFGPFYLCVS